MPPREMGPHKMTPAGPRDAAPSLDDDGDYAEKGPGMTLDDDGDYAPAPPKKTNKPLGLKSTPFKPAPARKL